MMKIKTFKILTLLTFTLFSSQITLSGQEYIENQNNDSISEYSLEQLKAYALENNYELQNAELEIQKSKALRWEYTAIGLPQISGSAQYQNFPDIPTQLLPDFISPTIIGINTQLFGLPDPGISLEESKMPVQFGSKHNADFGISFSQLVFSGEYIVGLKAAKIYLELSKKSKEKNIVSVKENTEKTYFLILVTEESIIALDSVLKSTAELLAENEQLQEAGFLEETDVEQLRLNLSSTESSLISFKKQRDILYRLLKFQIGMDFSKELKIAGKLDDVINEIEESSLFMDEFILSDNPDYKLIQVQENLSDLLLQREKTQYLPSLAAFFSYQKQSMSDSLNMFSKNADWYPTTVWGVKLSVPIFSSGLKRSKVKQAQIDLLQKRNIKAQTEQALMLEFEQTKSDFLISINNVRNTSEQRHLAKKIYENSLKKFKVGMEQSFMLTQYQTQYFMALSKYYQALNDLIDKHVTLKKLMNKL